MKKRILLWLIKKLLGGVPLVPTDALWELIDRENQKENPRCDVIDAWIEAAEKVRNYRK